MKTHVVTMTLLGSLMVAGSASAQTQQEGARDNRAQTETTRTNTGNGTAAAPCPEGCVAARRAQLSPEQRRRRAEARAAMRRRAEEDRLAQQQAEQDRARQLAELSASRDAAANRAEQERQARERAEREQANSFAQLESERQARLRAEQDINSMRARLAAMQQPVRPVARGGGPTGYRPRFTVGTDAGVAVYTRDVHRGVYAGGAWGVRAGVEFFPWLAVEGRYMGAANPGYIPEVGSVALVSNGGAGVLRLTAPIPYVQPYAFGGVGVMHSRPVGAIPDVQATRLTNTTHLAIPVGGGLNIPVHRNWAVTVEGTYNHMHGEQYSRDAALRNGSLVTGTAGVRFSM